MKHKLYKKQSGFTLVELLLATTFFSFILLFISVGFIQINRIYHSAVITKNAQNNARSIFEQLSRDAKEGSTLFVSDLRPGVSFCFGVGDVRYFYDNSARQLRRALTSDCLVAERDGVVVHEPNLNVYRLSVTPVKIEPGGVVRSLHIDITLGVAGAGLVDTSSPQITCATGITGALHLCSVVRFSGAVSTRGTL